MSMIHSHPVLDANARAKAIIDAVTGHQPSTLDCEYSSEAPATSKQIPPRKAPKYIGSKTSSNLCNPSSLSPPK